MIKSIFISLFALSMLPVSSTAQEFPAPFGVWRTQMHGALVEMRLCSDNSPCAFLKWFNPTLTRGITNDLRNPNRAQRTRALIGVPILWGLRNNGNGWDNGKIYNPETGQTFKGSMRIISENRIQVTGCWGHLCRSEIWIRN